MAEPLKLLCVFAHPDDETLFAGGLLAKYAAEGIETYLICATRGEVGWAHPAIAYPGVEGAGRHREAELRCAAQVLGVRELFFLDYMDGSLDQAPAAEAASRIAAVLRRVRPDVVVTMDPQGMYGHADHIALTQFTLAGVIQAGAAGPEDGCPGHLVSKVYMLAPSFAAMRGYNQMTGGAMRSRVDGVIREPSGWPGWLISAQVDTGAYWNLVLRALDCHKSQIRSLEPFAAMPARQPVENWGIATFYRVSSLVNGGRAKETDLFEGLR